MSIPPTSASTVDSVSPTLSYSPTPISKSPEYQMTESATGLSASSLSQSAPVSTKPKYSVASHSVRITKHGYAIDPVELKYPEIINNAPASSRRASEVSFSSNEVGHQVLGLIRGFWSQPAFPRGRVVKLDSQYSINSILADFGQYPPYPHKETFGSIGKQARVNSKSSKSRRSRRAQMTKISLLPNESTGAGKVSSPDFKMVSPRSPTTSDQTDDYLNKNIRDKFSSLLPASPSASHMTPALKQQQHQHHQQYHQNQQAVAATKRTSSSSTKRRSSSSDSLLSLFVSRHSSKIASPPTTFHSWIPTNKEQICDLLTNLCQQMESIFTNEARIINIASPCTVLGDIHGNLSDLRTYERSLWPKAPNCVSCNYLFLGDYVDRGDYSVECVLYLFSMKLIAPNRFFLLRGNHEVAAIQRQYTFSQECEAKFGPNGRQMWRNFNKVFDRMPVAAVIDDQIFCAHGGIPRSISEIKTLIKEIPSPLDNPEIQCPSAWEILWNDPITDSELVGMIEMDNATVTHTTQITNANQTAEATRSAVATKPLEEATNDKSPATSADEMSPSIQTTTDSKSDTNKETNVSKADSILSRDPELTGALSFYIRPDTSNQEQQNTTTDKTKISNNGNAKPIGTASKEASSKEREDNNDSSETMRTVPSDTSSIASTSPQQMMNDGFVSNIKRGTAFLFSDQAIKNFLKLNNLSHVIRAHEVIPTGFAFHGDGRVITIFSSSKYCGLNNQAACALIAQERIRILRLDTGDAGE